VGTLVFAARFALAVALAYSAAAKVHEGRALPAQMRAFGIPGSFAVVTAVAVPALELAIAVSLLGFVDSPVPAFAAIALLAVFTGALLANLARDDPAPCPCFGAPAQRPVSARALVRNGWLLALAVLATDSGERTQNLAVLLVVAVAFAVFTLYVVRATS
jgi:hypothetical protein